MIEITNIQTVYKVAMIANGSKLDIESCIRTKHEFIRNIDTPMKNRNLNGNICMKNLEYTGMNRST